MRRNADGARNLFAPVEIGEEVLAEALACHGWNSVAGEVIDHSLEGWKFGRDPDVAT